MMITARNHSGRRATTPSAIDPVTSCAKSVTKSHDYLADLEQRLSEINVIPALLIFGDTDGTIKMGWLDRLERIFPRHRSIIMKGSHHFPQVYDSAAVADAIRSFWDEVVTVA